MRDEVLLAAVIAMILPSQASAATTNSISHLKELNGPGVNGVAGLSYDDVAMTLNATWLEPNLIHRVG